MADYKSTSAKITVVEASDANSVPFKQGQLIIEDSGNCFYDLSTQSNKATGRKSLSSLTDFTQYIKDSELLAKIQNLYGVIADGNNNPVSGGQIYAALQAATSGGSQLPQVTSLTKLPASGIYSLSNCLIPWPRSRSHVYHEGGTSVYTYPNLYVSGILVCNGETCTVISNEGCIYTYSIQDIGNSDRADIYCWTNITPLSSWASPPRVFTVTHDNTVSSVNAKNWIRGLERLDTVIYEIGSDMTLTLDASDMGDGFGHRFIFMIRVVGDNVKINFKASYFINGTIPKIEKDKTYMVTLYGSWAMEVHEIVKETYITADDVSYTS